MISNYYKLKPIAMKKTMNLWLMGAMALVVAVMTACGGGSNSPESEAAALPVDGILGVLPKVVAEYEAAEAAAAAKYDELKASDPEKANEFWKDYIGQGNTTRFKKETLPAVSKTLEGKEIPGEVAEGLPIRLEGNFVLNDSRDAYATAVFTAEASNETFVYNFIPVAFDTDGNAISMARSVSFSDYPIKEGKELSIRFYISVNDYDAAGWARLGKIVVMDKTTDAFKKAEEYIKAREEAFKNRK